MILMAKYCEIWKMFVILRAEQANINRYEEQQADFSSIGDPDCDSLGHHFRRHKGADQFWFDTRRDFLLPLFDRLSFDAGFLPPKDVCRQR